MNREPFHSKSPDVNMTWSEFIEFVDDPQRHAKALNSSHDSAKTGFRSLASWVDMVSAAKRGWPEGLEKIQRSLVTARAVVGTARRAIDRYDVGGERPHVPLACAGEPRSMVRRAPILQRVRPSIRILLNITAGFTIPTSYLINRGAAVLAWCDALETAGFSTEITTVYACDHMAMTMKYRVEVKRAGDKFDIDRLSFALACPDYMRRAHFAMQETGEHAHRCTTNGAYGHVARATPDVGQVYVPSVPSGSRAFATPESSAVAIRDIIAADYPGVTT